MKVRNRSNVLLVEILIAVLFFMLSATVLVRVFVTARNMTVRSGVKSVAVAEAQNVAEAMYAADDIDQMLEEQGFRRPGVRGRGRAVDGHGERLLQAARSRRRPGGGRGAVFPDLHAV